MPAPAKKTTKLKSITDRPLCETCSTCTKTYFSVLSKDELNILEKNKLFIRAKKNQAVFHEGTNSTGMFCLYKGKVKVFKQSKNGREFILKLLKPGNWFGYRSVLGKDNYSDSAVSLEESEICFIPKDIFVLLTKSNQMFCGQTTKLLTEDLKQAQQLVFDQVQKQVRSRIADALFLLEDYYGSDRHGLIKSEVKRSVVGNMAGTTIESAIRILGEFNKIGAIKIQGKKISISDRDLLKQISEDF